MKRAVVDTNVGVVANGKAAGVSLQCQLSAVNALGELLSKGEVVVDVAGEMQTEYRRHFNPSGQPGGGDRFFYQVINNYVRGILRVSIPKNSNGSYVDFPSDPALKKFDLSDRKFGELYT